MVDAWPGPGLDENGERGGGGGLDSGSGTVDWDSGSRAGKTNGGLGGGPDMGTSIDLRVKTEESLEVNGCETAEGWGCTVTEVEAMTAGWF